MVICVNCGLTGSKDKVRKKIVKSIAIETNFYEIDLCIHCYDEPNSVVHYGYKRKLNEAEVKEYLESMKFFKGKTQVGKVLVFIDGTDDTINVKFEMYPKDDKDGIHAAKMIISQAQDYKKKLLQKKIKKFSKSKKNAKVKVPKYTVAQTWGALKKAWRGYNIAKAIADRKKMIQYAKKIREFQRDLKVPVAAFEDLGLT